MGLKVLYIVSILPPYPGGAAVCYSNILSELADGREHGISEVRVLTEKGCFTNYGGAVKVHDRLYNYDSAEKKDKRFFNQVLNYLIIMGAILFTRKDIVQIHARYVYAKYIGRIIWLVLLATRSKVVIDIRDRFYDNLGFSHNFLVCSRELGEFYHWIEKKEHIPIPMEFKELRKDIQKKHQIAYMGTIALNKGIMELLEGYGKYLEESSNPLELRIWGQNMLGKEFEDKVAGLGKAEYMGSAPSSEIYSKILECKGVILPSKSEGMPRICLETMYCKRLIVCHASITSITPYIPRQFILNEISPEEIKRVFFAMEAFEGEINYAYDLAAHSRDRIAADLVGFYNRVLN
ncbi:MAG: glycosyltransferase [Deltaproteobacteria bacterium]|nr:glycosyltransferase [Deltaproteobacteria bacterium]